MSGTHRRRSRSAHALGSADRDRSLTGTYRDGTLTVETQEQPPREAPPPVDAVPPCAPPEGGWPRDPALLPGPGHEPEGDANVLAEQPALDRYRARHPSDVVTLAFVRPSPDSVLLGIGAVDEAAAARAEEALRPAYGVRLCVVVSRIARADVDAAREEFGVGGADATRLGVLGGPGESVSDDLQVEVGYDVVMMTDELVRRSEDHPPGLLVLRPWLVPTA